MAAHTVLMEVSMLIIKTAGEFGYNECGDVKIRIECYEQEIIARALRYYVGIPTVEYRNEIPCYESTGGTPEALTPDLSSSEEWLIRTTSLRDEVAKKF